MKKDAMKLFGVMTQINWEINEFANQGIEDKLVLEVYFATGFCKDVVVFGLN